MRLVIQRVSEASVETGGRIVSKIARGLLVLVGAERGDGSEQAEEAARKIAGLRVFSDADGKMNLSLGDVSGSVLAVSQFTLAADLTRGRRPGFDRALPGVEARPLFDHFCAALELGGVPVARGVFGADMKVSLVNDGPATFVMDVREGRQESGVGGREPSRRGEAGLKLDSTTPDP
jgi:D-tyrosyl-tRNA(Tyr) deacylase